MLAKGIFTVLLISLFIYGCGNDKDAADTDAVRDIRYLEEQWANAVQTADIEKISSFFAEDAVMMIPDTSIIEGRENIKEVLTAIFQDTLTIWSSYFASIDSVEVAGSGDLAYVRITDRVSRVTPLGNTEVSSKGVDIWKKIDGQWKTVLSIGNNNNPVNNMPDTTQ
jgi:uncharacterized protein (TIGR02246 family)